MSWWRRNWRWLLATLLTSLGFAAVLILVVLRKREEVAQLRAQISLAKAAAKVDGLEADKTARKQELADNIFEAAKVEKEIVAAKKAAVAIVKETKAMDDGSISDEFSRLGY